MRWNVRLRLLLLFLLLSLVEVVEGGEVKMLEVVGGDAGGGTAEGMNDGYGREGGDG